MKRKSKASCAAVLWLAFLVGLAVPVARADLEALYAKAEQLMQKHKHASAAVLLQQVVDQAPVGSDLALEALRSLREAYESSWAPARFAEAAERELERIRMARLGEDAAKEARRAVIELLAEHHAGRRRYPAAIKRYRELLHLSAPKAAAGVESTLAALYEQAGRLEEAADLRRRRLDRNPRNRWERQRLGRLYLRLGRIDDGLKLLKADGKPERVYPLAQEAFQQRRYDEAETLAARIAKQHAAAALLRAEALYAQRKYADAVAAFQHSYTREDTDSDQLVRVAQRLARAHAARGTLKDAIRTCEAKLAGGKLTAKTAAARRKGFGLLAELRRRAGDPVGAATAWLDRRGQYVGPAAPEPPARDWRLAELTRAAVRHLLKGEDHGGALRLLDRIARQGEPGAWLQAARYAVLRNAGRKKQAQQQLRRAEAASAGDEARLFALARALDGWAADDEAERVYGRVTATKPAKSRQDVAAYGRLIDYAMRRGKWREAARRCDALDACLTDANRRHVDENTFRSREAYVRFRAAGGTIDALITMLDNRNLARRMAAAEAAGRYGRPGDVTALKARIRRAPEPLQKALRAAIRRIRSRAETAALRPRPIGVRELRKDLAKRAKVLWIEKDHCRRELRWAGLEKHFVVLANTKTGLVSDFDEVAASLGNGELTPSGIVFAPERVWVGTDHGLFAYERWARSWNRYSVGRKHRDVPVQGLELDKELLSVTVRTRGGTRTFRFHLRMRRWLED
jgi:hypothetical protein